MIFESNRTIVLYGIGSEYVYEAVEIALRAVAPSNSANVHLKEKS